MGVCGVLVLGCYYFFIFNFMVGSLLRLSLFGEGREGGRFMFREFVKNNYGFGGKLLKKFKIVVVWGWDIWSK